MAEFSSLPLFTDAWVADTAHLTRLERGLYMDLLILIWRSPECQVPNDLAWIARKLRASEAEMEALQSVIAEFCVNTGNWVSQKRLKMEWDYVFNKSKKNSEAAKSRWNKEKEICERNAPTPTPTPTKKERGKPLSPSPDGFDEFWAASPRKTGKDDALRAYIKARKNTDARTLIEAMGRYAEERRGQDPQYTKHPATWLNKGCWKDEPQSLTLIPGGNHGKPSASAERLNAFVAGARRSP